MGHSKLLGDDVLLHLSLVWVIVRWQPSNQFIEQHAQAVEIQRPSIGLIEQQFWAKIFRTAAYGLGLIEFGEVFLRKSKVSEPEMTPFINENIFWLEVSVQNVVLVKMFDSKNGLSEKQTSLLWSKAFVLLDQIEEVTTWTEVEDQI